MLSFPRFPLPKKAFCCYWIKPVKIPADIHPFCSARSNRSIKSKAKPSRAPFCARKGITVSKTKSERKKSEPPNYKFMGGETEEIGSPNVVFMRPQLAQVYNENFVDVQERGQRKLFRKSK